MKRNEEERPTGEKASQKTRAHLDHDNTLIESNRHLIRILAQTNTPRALQRVAERILDAVRSGVPDLYCPILTSTDNNRQIRVEYRERNIVRVSFHGLDATLAQVVPDLDGLVIGGGDEVGLVGARVEFDVVDAFVVGLEGEVRGGVGDGPDLHSSVETGGSEGVGVLGVEREVHNIVCVSFECLTRSYPSFSKE